MKQRNAGKWVAALIVLAVPCLLFWAGCSKDPMSADTSPPVGTRITHPEDGDAISSQITHQQAGNATYFFLFPSVMDFKPTPLFIPRIAAFDLARTSRNQTA